MAKNTNLDNVAMALSFAGGINWGLIGLFNYNLVESLVGGIMNGVVASGVYVAVGISALYLGWKVFN